MSENNTFVNLVKSEFINQDGLLIVRHNYTCGTFNSNTCNIEEYENYAKLLLEANFQAKYSITLPLGWYISEES